MPVSSASRCWHAGQIAAEDAAQDRIEEEHRLAAQRTVRPAGLEEHHRRAGQATQLDLARDALDELVARLRLGCEGGSGHDGPATVTAAPARAASNAW